MPSKNFTNLSQHVAKAAIDFSAVTVKALLINTTIPTEANLDAWINRSDVSNEHAASGGYAAGGFDCDTVVGAVDATNNSTDITITPVVGNGNPAYTNSTISSAGAIIYVSTGNAANDKLIGFVDFDGTVSSIDGDFKIAFSTPIIISV